MTLKIDYAIYALLSFGASALSFYKLGYLAKNLSVESFGIYSLITLSFVYIGYIGSLGSNEYMLKKGASITSAEKIPLFLIRNNALVYGFAGVLSVSLIVFISNVLFFKDTNSYLVYTSIILALVTYPYSIFESYYRSQRKILVFSGMLFVKTIFVILGIYLLTQKYGAIGAIFSEIVAILVIVIFFFVRKYKDIFFTGLEKPKTALKNIISDGFYICLSNLFRNLSSTADRYVVVLVFGLNYFGIYSFVMILYQGMVLLSGITMNIIGPKIIHYYAYKNSKETLFTLLCKSSALILALGLIFYPPFYYLTPKIILVFFKQYHSSPIYLSLNFIYWTSVVSFLIFLFDWFFICISKEGIISLMSILSLIVTFCSIPVFSHFNIAFPYYSLFLLFSKIMIFSAMGYWAFKLKR